MRSYTDRNGRTWTPAERTRSLALTKRAIAEGLIPPATRCARCGQDRGIVQYHNHDYSDPVKFLEALCWRCHMVHHSRHIAPKACTRYEDEVKGGKRYPPVFRHNFAILCRDHGICK
jgi:hypothetical protein